MKDVPILLTDVTQDSSTALSILARADIPFESMRNEQDNAGGPILIASSMTYRGLERVRQFILDSR